MSFFKLTINGYVADIGDVSTFNSKFNRVVTDMQNISESNGDFSLTLRLPKSDRNNIIFDHSQRMETIDKFVRDENYDARVETYGNNASDWLIKLQAITDDFYEIVMIGKNISWASLIEQKTLPELTNYDSTPWTFPFIGASGNTVQYSHAWHVENDNYDTSDVAFPLIPRGHFYSPITGNTNVNYFYNNSLTISDIPPAPFELKIVKKIFEGIGWTVDGDVFTNTEHQKVVLPFTSGDYYQWNTNYLYNSESFGTIQKAGNYGSFPPIFTSPYQAFDDVHIKNYLSSSASNPRIVIKNLDQIFLVRDPINCLSEYSFTRPDTTVGQASNYKVPVDGKINIDIDISFNEDEFNYENQTTSNYNVAYPIFNNPRSGFFLYIHTDDVTTKSIYEDIADYMFNTSSSASLSQTNIIYYFDCYQTAIYQTPTSFQPYNNNADISATWTIGATNSFLQIGLTGGSVHVEIRDLYVDNDMDLRLAWVQPGISNQNFDSQVNITSTRWKFFGDTGDTTNGINISKSLPQVSQLDFIRSWVAKSKLFMTYSNDDKAIRFDTFDNFYLPQDFAYDITSKVDPNYGEPSTKPMNLPTNMYFKYSNDGGDVLVAQDMDYANLQISSNNIYTQGDQTISLLYSSTRLRNYTFIPSAVTVNLPMIATEQDTSIGNLTEVSWNFNATVPRILKTDDYLTDLTGGTVYMMVDGYLEKILLSRFDDDRPGRLSLKWDGNNGLYRYYYDRYLNQIEQSHILSVNTNINAYDFNRLQPNVPVKFMGQHYFLNKIQGFDPNNNAAVAKIELIKKFTN